MKDPEDYVRVSTGMLLFTVYRDYSSYAAKNSLQASENEPPLMMSEEKRLRM